MAPRPTRGAGAALAAVPGLCAVPAAPEGETIVIYRTGAATTALLDDTSAMVLLLAGGRVHTSRDAARYLGMLDLSPGRDLYEHCMRICPYYDTVIQGRKKAVLDMCMRTISERGVSQAVIFGSGMDALSLEIASARDDVRVFEMDRSNMLYKKSLLDSLGGKACGRISCICSDLRSHEVTASLLEAHGWDSTEPTLLVFEGISYYVPERLLFDLVRRLGSGERRDYVVLEYLVKESHISEGLREVPNLVFGNIASRYGVPIARYSRQDIQDRLGAEGGAVLEIRDMARMERDLDGRNTHLGDNGSGWIEVCFAEI